jgi:hypothetical protein
MRLTNAIAFPALVVALAATAFPAQGQTTNALRLNNAQHTTGGWKLRRMLPLFSYQHGTLTQTNEAPSSMNLSGEVSVGIAFATSGYAAVVPDYLGLGDSPGLHPYHHARSEATACVDMLRAAKSFCTATRLR